MWSRHGPAHHAPDAFPKGTRSHSPTPETTTRDSSARGSRGSSRPAQLSIVPSTSPLRLCPESGCFGDCALPVRREAHSHPVSEAAQSPRLLIVRPQSSLSSTDSKLVSRDPLREKCDGPRSPTAVARRGWLERDSADRTHKHWSPTTSSAIFSQSTGPVRRHWSPTASSVAISHASVS